jgi:signal transduction histidine kinase
MQFILNFRLFGFAIGAALQLSLFLLIKRYRSIRKLERLFLGLVTCLFFWNLSNLLSDVFLTNFPSRLLLLTLDAISFGVLSFLPSLLLHIHLEFQQKYLTKPLFRLNRVLEFGLYSPLLILPWALVDFVQYYPAESILTATVYARPFAAWFSFSLLASVFIEWKMFRQRKREEERYLYAVLMIVFLVVAGMVFYGYYVSDFHTRIMTFGYFETMLMLWSIVPSAWLGYYIFRYNFLEIAIQRSLGYSFAAILLLLVYLLSVRWLRNFLEAHYNSFPGMIVEAGLILALLAFAQPLKRWIDTSVGNLFSLEISTFQKMAVRLDEVSRSTVEMDQLLRFIEDLLQKELDLRDLRVLLYSQPRRDERHEEQENPLERDLKRIFLSKNEETLGEIQIRGQSGGLSTEQQAGLRFLVTQIVAAIENCKLAEGKVRLERELAERDKMATLGQMAATVAHNIKNPLSSIKTIVQLMQEDDHVNAQYARDLALINSEIDRLGNSVAQLLTFSKPTVFVSVQVDLAGVLERVLSIFKPEAERKGIHLHYEASSARLTVLGSEEILSEIFQNLIVNALEVSPQRSQVTIRTAALERDHVRKAVVGVEDEGSGISSGIRQHIFKPFFTTKQKGTGLGLAVVQRRVLDLGGEIDCISPLSQNGGTRFEVVFPLAS